MIDRLLRANRTVLAVPTVSINGTQYLVGIDGSLVPFTAPTAAVLNGWAATLTTTPDHATHGGNISCSLLDDLALGLGDSETDDELTICSIGNESTPTFYNVEATLTGFRDRNIGDTGVYNLFTSLMNAVSSSYVLVDRIGEPSSTLFEVGEDVSLYEVSTDYPVDVKEDRGNLKLQQSPTATGIVNVNYTLAA